MYFNQECNFLRIDKRVSDFDKRKAYLIWFPVLPFQVLLQAQSLRDCSEQEACVQVRKPSVQLEETGVGKAWSAKGALSGTGVILNMFYHLNILEHLDIFRRFGIYCNLKIYWNVGIELRFLMPSSLGSTADHMEVWRMSTYVSVQQRTWGDISTWESSCKRLSKSYSAPGAHINMSWNIEVARGPI